MRQLKDMMTTTIVDVVGPMFEQQNEEIAEQHFDSIEQRLHELNEKIDDQTATLQDRIENMSEDILARLVTKLDDGTKPERDFAKLTLNHQVPILFRQLQAIAKKAGIKLPV